MKSRVQLSEERRFFLHTTRLLLIDRYPTKATLASGFFCKALQQGKHHHVYVSIQDPGSCGSARLLPRKPPLLRIYVNCLSFRLARAWKVRWWGADSSKMASFGVELSTLQSELHLFPHFIAQLIRAHDAADSGAMLPPPKPLVGANSNQNLFNSRNLFTKKAAEFYLGGSSAHQVLQMPQAGGRK